MRFSRFFVCFFLLISLTGFQETSSYQIELGALERQAMDCKEQQAAQVSQSLQEIRKEILKDLESVLNKADLNDIELKELKEKKKVTHRSYERLKKQMALYLMQEQSMYPYCLEGRILNEGKDLQTLYMHQKQLEEKCSQKEKKKVEFQLEIQNLQAYDKRVDKAQNTLKERFQRTDGFDQTVRGQHNPQKTIQGLEDLPVFGSIHSTKNDSHFSCLAQDASITSTSPYWGKVSDQGYISAGTWSYPHGGMHLGMDLALALYSNIYAPANGIVLYADTSYNSNDGYLGNMEGWPYGGGNTLCVIVSIQEKLYALTFAHLSNTIYVAPGQQFSQGDVLALSGNSGNSTGGHTHIEVFELHASLEQEVSYFQQGADFSFGCGWDAPHTQSIWATRIRPEEVITG